MILYSYLCKHCGYTEDIMMEMEDRDVPCGECIMCERDEVVRVCGNAGGFRLSSEGSVGWSEDGYSTTYGDAENFKAGHRIY